MTVPKRSIKQEETYFPARIKELIFNPTHAELKTAITDFINKGGKIERIKYDKKEEIFNQVKNETALRKLLRMARS